MIKTIGVVTSGGDAPGMNTAIRAVVRSGIYHGIRILGIKKGFAGLIENDIIEMELKSVGGIINRGGTILHTVRCPQFKERNVRAQAIEKLKCWGIDALIVIGGDGSLRGTKALSDECDIPCVVIPASIDNDLSCTDFSIGFDTAVNTAVEAIDKIRDTAQSHERVFIVEVMGRSNGFIALEVGLVCGAEQIIIPEIKFDINKICKKIIAGKNRGKSSSIVVIAEGAGHTPDIAKTLSQKMGLDVRISILGHIQRGGSPTAATRQLASLFGDYAIRLLLSGKKNKMVGISGEKLINTDFSEVIKKAKKIDLAKYKLADVLSI